MVMEQNEKQKIIQHITCTRIQHKSETLTGLIINGFIWNCFNMNFVLLSLQHVKPFLKKHLDAAAARCKVHRVHLSTTASFIF